MMTSTIRKFGVGVASLALVASMSVPAFAAGGNEAPKPLDGGWDRIPANPTASMDRIDTAIAVANAAYEANKAEAKSVYVANYLANIDAATAGQLTDGPILLVKDDSRVLKQVADEVKKFTSAKTVYAIGGTSVVSDAMLTAVAGSKATGRLAGEDRYDTAIKVAERVAELSPEKGKRLYLSRGDLAIDALTAGSLDDGPVLLVKNGTLTENTKKYIEAKKPTKVVGLGGATYVPDSVLDEAKLPAIKENPAAKYDEMVALERKFLENRTLYLGNNKYRDDHTSVELQKDAEPGTSSDPKAIPEDVQPSFGNASNRWMGYKAQLAELQERMDDVVAPAINRIKGAAKNELTDLKQAQANGKIRLEDFVREVNADSAIYKAAKSLYGVTLKLNLSDKDFYVLTPDSKYPNNDAKAYVDDINWSKFTEQDVYKTANKDADKMLTEYKRNFGKNEADLYTGDYADAAKNSNRLSVKRDMTITGDLTADTLISKDEYLIVVKNTLDGLITIANSNASITKAAMEDALSKIDDGTSYVRLWGEDRYETAAQISAYRRASLGKRDVNPGGNLSRIYIANGITMVDALVAGVFTQGPILLSDANGNLPEATVKELKGIGASNVRYSNNVPFVRIIGGKSVILDKTGSAASAALKEGYNGKPEKKKAVAQDTIHADSKTVKVANATIANATAPVLAAVFQVKDGTNNFDNTGQDKIKDIKVYNADNNLNSAVQPATTSGSFTVNLDLTTAKFGTYTVEYKVNNKTYKTSLTYELGDATDVADTNDTAAQVSYEFATGSAYDAAKVYPVTNTGLGSAVGGATVASGKLTGATTAGDVINKTLVVLANNQPAKVIKTSKDHQKLTTPTLNAGSPSAAEHGKTVSIATISNYNVLKDLVDTSKGVKGFKVEFIKNGSDPDPKDNPIEVTNITAGGVIEGKIPEAFANTKKFDVKVTALGDGTVVTDSDASTSTEVTMGA